MIKKAKIAEFKSHLSAYLNEVRQGGEVVILDRNTPVARLVSVETQASKLTIHPPKIKGGLKNLKFPKLKIGEIDIVKLVRETRGNR